MFFLERAQSLETKFIAAIGQLSDSSNWLNIQNFRTSSLVALYHHKKIYDLFVQSLRELIALLRTCSCYAGFISHCNLIVQVVMSVSFLTINFLISSQNLVSVVEKQLHTRALNLSLRLGRII